jgi:hypothetical protein
MSTSTTLMPRSISCLVSSTLMVKLEEGTDETGSVVFGIDEGETVVLVAGPVQPTRVIKRIQSESAVIFPRFLITIYLKTVKTMIGL